MGYAEIIWDHLDQEKCLGYAGYSTVWSLACRLDDVGSVVRDVVDWEVVLNC